jgi:pimeloyl-ACP methyl ester carboxylesterase
MQFRKLLVRAMLGGVVVLAGALALGGIAELVLARRDAHRFPPPGRLVDVGGRRLHLQCAGAASPTLLFEMGAGAWSVFWTRIHREMAGVTRSCLYDRAGFGWSDPGPLPRSPDALLADLQAVVERSGERGPYVLVGHSMGGWLVRLYQARHPESIVGMALVESAHPRQWTELPGEIWDVTRSSAGVLRWLSVAGRFGVLRLLTGQLAAQQLPPDVIEAYRAAAVRPSALAASASEIVNSEQLAAEVGRLGDLGDLPLVVVSAGRSFDAFRDVAPDWPFEEANAIWSRLQRELVTLSSRAWYRESPESTHNIHTDDPALVVTALKALVDTVRATATAGGGGAGNTP